MSTHVVCPSGLSGIIRGLKVSEERILADRELVRNGGQVDALLAACWLETTNHGPYSASDGPVDWSKVLVGDRFYTLLQVRAATYGPEYAFAVHCQSDACRSRIDWEVSLCDLPTRTLSESSRAALAAGNRFETQLLDGRRVWFKLLTGADERRLPKLRRQSPDRLLSTVLALRIHEVEGVRTQDNRRFFEDLSMREANALLRAFDEMDCGVETGITIECSECSHVQDVDLPLGPGFLMPTKSPHSNSSPPSTSTPGARLSFSSAGSSMADPA